MKLTQTNGLSKGQGEVSVWGLGFRVRENEQVDE